MTSDEVRAHYVKIWGEPSREARFALGRIEMRIFKWDASKTEEGVNLYATCGASTPPAPTAGGKHAVEFVTGILPEEDGIAKGLALLGTFPHSGQSVSYGESVTLPDPLWDGGSMDSFLAVRPMEDLLPGLELANGVHVQFVNVVPVFSSEIEYRKGRSAEWLMGEFNDHRVPWWNPQRGRFR